MRTKAEQQEIAQLLIKWFSDVYIVQNYKMFNNLNLKDIPVI